MKNHLNLDLFFKRTLSSDATAFYMKMMLGNGNSIPGYFKLASSEAAEMYCALLRPQMGSYTGREGTVSFGVQFIGCGNTEYDPDDRQYKVPYYVTLIE